MVTPQIPLFSFWYFSHTLSHCLTSSHGLGMFSFSFCYFKNIFKVTFLFDFSVGSSDLSSRLPILSPLPASPGSPGRLPSSAAGFDFAFSPNPLSVSSSLRALPICFRCHPASIRSRNILITVIFHPRPITLTSASHRRRALMGSLFIQTVFSCFVGTPCGSLKSLRAVLGTRPERSC